MMPITAVQDICSMIESHLVALMFRGVIFYGAKVQAKGSEKQLSRSFSTRGLNLGVWNAPH